MAGPCAARCAGAPAGSGPGNAVPAGPVGRPVTDSVIVVAEADVEEGAPPCPAAHPRLALLALATGGFAIGTTEFVTMGLLPEVAHGVGITIPTAGHVVSAYAAGVVVGAPVLASLGAKLPRKTLLLWLMLAFAVANIGSALATTYPVLMAARFASGLPHGAFFGVGSLVAASMVPVPPPHLGGVDDAGGADRGQHRGCAADDHASARTTAGSGRMPRSASSRCSPSLAVWRWVPFYAVTAGGVGARRAVAPSTGPRCGSRWASARSASAACSRRTPTSRRP